MDTTVTRPGTPTTMRPQALTTEQAVSLARLAHPFHGPRARLLATPARQWGHGVTDTSIFAQWQAADRIDGGGKSLIREIEG